MDELELPPKLPKPPLWMMWPAFLAIEAISFLLLMAAATSKYLAFQAGSMSTIGAFLLLRTLEERRKVAQLQAEMERAYNTIKQHLAMMPKLLERYNPDEAMSILNYAEILVKDGDFPDLPTAVASIERHHDNEPTAFDEP